MKSIFTFDLDMIPSRDEFNKRYHGTFMLLNIKDKEHLVYCHGAQCYDKGIYVDFQDTDGNSYRIFQESECSLTVKFPETGWFNHPDGNTYYWSRKPERQWQRGISGKNSSVESLESVLFNYRLRPDVNTFSTVDAALTDKTFTLDEVFNSNRMGTALNKQFAIFKHDNNLWWIVHGFGIVGNINRKKQIEIDPLSKQDFKDYLTSVKEKDYVWM